MVGHQNRKSPSPSPAPIPLRDKAASRAVTVRRLIAEVFLRVRQHHRIRIGWQQFADIRQEGCRVGYPEISVVVDHEHGIRWVPYFYKKQLLEVDHESYEKLLYASELLANFLEHVTLQKDNMEDGDWPVWESFFIDTFHRSPMVRAYLNEFSSWYAKELMAIAETADRTPEKQRTAKA
jgi:hypothetical protein